MIELEKDHIGEQVKRALRRRGFEETQDGFKKRIANFAEAGAISDGARVVCLTIDETGRWLSRLGGLGVENDVDLRNFWSSGPDAAIDSVMAQRPQPDMRRVFSIKKEDSK